MQIFHVLHSSTIGRFRKKKKRSFFILGPDCGVTHVLRSRPILRSNNS